MNVHESEQIAGILQKLGYEQSSDVSDADVVVFNTCAIRESAETKIIGNIGALKSLKKNNPNIIIAVIGCMTQIKNSVDTLAKKFPWIDIIIGNHNKDDFQKYLLDAQSGKKTIDILDKERAIVESKQFFRTSGVNAWVNISYGCNNFCTYCIVPYVRGRERSRCSRFIIEECKDLVKQGYKTITLLGQNVNSYGNDNSQEIDFPTLCQSICDLDGDFRLKFISSHPKDFSQQLIDVIAKNEKMSRSIHLPMQSGSDRILKLMNRNYTAEKYFNIIDRIKAKIPNPAITSDFIVGFPSESEDDFDATVEAIKKVQFNGIFAFMYSKRSGTVASTMDNQIPLQIRKQRVTKLLSLEKEIIEIRNKQNVGKVFDCLIEKIEKKNIATTDYGKEIELINDTDFQPLQFTKVIVTECKGSKLFGKILEK